MKVSMVAGIVIILLNISYGILAGGSFLLFMSIPALLMVSGILIGGILISFGGSVPFKALKESLWGKGVHALDELRIYVNFFNLASQLSIAGGVVGALIGLISMLARMTDPSTIGSSMAVALITALYGVFLSELVFQPLKHALITKSAEVCENTADADSGQSKNNRWIVLGLGVFNVTPFLVLIISMT